MNMKLKWGTAGRFRRAAAILGAVGLVAGAGLATAGSALAAVGTQPGNLTLSLPSGSPLTSTPTWSTTTPCPAGFQTSANLAEFTLGGTLVSLISPNVTAGLTSPFSGTLDGNVGALLNTTGSGLNATNPGTDEWVVQCWSGPGGTGTSTPVQSLFVSVALGATTFTTSSTPPAQVATTTTLTVTPNTGVTTTTTVTLTATVTAADGTAPAGSVTFFNGATAINASPIAVTWTTTAPITGTASTTTTFTTSGSFAITAKFTPTPTTYAASTSAATNLSVTLAGSLNAGGVNPVVINVTVAATGTLTVTVAAGPVNLAVTGLTGTGNLPGVSIKDTRNNFPGWSVLGQESAFTSTALPSTPISGNQLGWVPAAATGSAAFDGTHVVLGGTVAPASPGLGTTAATLALAHAGFGADPLGNTTYIATAALTLTIPPVTTAGAYTGNLTVTYLSAQA